VKLICLNFFWHKNLKKLGNMNYPINLIAIPVAAIIPIVVGFIWYHPKVLGKIWMKSSAMRDEKTVPSNIFLITGISYVFNLLVAFILGSLVVHQTGVFAIFVGEPEFGNPNAASTQELMKFMEIHGSKFRTFGHGVLHGVISGLFFVMPIIATNALHEKKGFNYIAINSAYWILSLALMGGLISAWQ
jgi:hypothetical protein